MYRKIQIFVLQSHLPQNINTFWLAIYYTYTHTLSLFSLRNRRQSSKRIFSLLQITSPRERSVCYSNPKICPRETCRLHQYFPTNAYFRTSVRLFSIFSSIEAKERERKNIYIYWRLNALVRRSVYSWCAQGWDSSPGRETSRTGSASATAPRAREDDEEAQEVELDLEPGKYVWGCLLCYIFARRTGWPFKTPSLSLGVPLVSLGNRGDKGALSNPRKIRELSRGSPFSAPSSSHYHPTDNKRGAEIKRYTRSSSILVHSNPA